MCNYSFTDAFDSICFDSSGKAAMRVEESPAYEKIKQNKNELMDLLSRKLGKQELLNELNELIDCVTDLPVMERMAVYKQAFHDCVNLLNWLGLLNLETQST